MRFGKILFVLILVGVVGAGCSAEKGGVAATDSPAPSVAAPTAIPAVTPAATPVATPTSAPFDPADVRVGVADGDCPAYLIGERVLWSVDRDGALSDMVGGALSDVVFSDDYSRCAFKVAGLLGSDAVVTADFDGSRFINEDIYRRGIYEDGRKAWIYGATADFDGDGADEAFNAFYMWDTDEELPLSAALSGHDVWELRLMVSGKNGTVTAAYTGDNIKFPVKFAQFDESGRTQIYVEERGPSADPRTTIYEYDGAEVDKLLEFDGFINRFDGKGGIWSDVINPDWCRYDLRDGLVPTPFAELRDKTLTMPFNVLLFGEKGHYTEAIISHYYETDLDDYLRGGKDSFVKMVAKGEQMTILEMDFEPFPYRPDDGLYWFPWLKVETADGAKGWFCVIYGD